MSDIHGDFGFFDKALDGIVRPSDAEVLAINGDLSGEVFEGEEIKAFQAAAQIIENVRQQVYQATQGKVGTFHGCAEFLLREDVKAGEDVKNAARQYLFSEENARQRMLGTYRELKERFDGLSQRVVLVPGNWDGKCIDDILGKRNLHNKPTEEINGVNFSGYGGAESYPNVLPLDLTIDFDEDEAFAQLCENGNAEVLLLHTPLRGFSKNGNDLGNYCFNSVMYRNAPSLILSGHSHQRGIFQDPKTKTVVVNPGNLGRYNGSKYGTFLELELDDNLFVKPTRNFMVDESGVTESKFEERE